MSNQEKFIFKYRYAILFICCLFTCFFNIFPSWQEIFNYSNQIILIFGIIITLFLYLIIFWKKPGFSERNIIFLLFAIGFVFRLTYVQSTGHLSRQHDVGGKMGHLEYIMTLVEGKGLPQTDVSKLWQYYQPPLWHTICAVWIKIQFAFGVAEEAALENLQHISLFCSTAIMFISHKLFRLFNLEKAPLVIACAIVAFHPTFIILSGSINNDVMSLMLALLAVVLAIQWYRDPKFSNIIPLGFVLGISMGVKVSGGLVAVGIATLFAVRLFGKKYPNKLNLVGQFASFGVICVPLALWWQIRNFVKFGIPLTYIPGLSDTHSQYVGFRSVFERFFDFSSLRTAGVYPARIPRDYDFYEYNIPLGALKSSVFGEYYIGKDTGIEIFSVILFYSAAILAVLSVISAVYVVVKAVKDYKNNGEITATEYIYPLICGATMIGSYIKFCFDFAHFCTMDFRYIAMTIVFGALYLGLFTKLTHKNNKILGIFTFELIIVCTVSLCVSSLMLYGTIG